MKKKNKHNRKNRLLFLAVVLCIVSVITMVVILCYPKAEKNEFVPPAFDENAVMGEPDIPEELGWQMLDAKIFQAGICGKVVLDGTAADVWFTNPSKNEVWLRLRVLDETGRILGETGIIKPGEYVQSVRFHVVPKTGTAIVMKIMAYEPDTYYSEGAVALNTIISGK